MAVNDHCTGLLKWTTGMDYWTVFLCTKIIFMAYNKISLPVKTLDNQSVTVSSISQHRTTYKVNNRWRWWYCYCYKRRQLVFNLCEGSSTNSYMYLVLQARSNQPQHGSLQHHAQGRVGWVWLARLLRTQVSWEGKKPWVQSYSIDSRVVWHKLTLVLKIKDHSCRIMSF